MTSLCRHAPFGSSVSQVWEPAAFRLRSMFFRILRRYRRLERYNGDMVCNRSGNLCARWARSCRRRRVPTRSRERAVLDAKQADEVPPGICLDIIQPYYRSDPRSIATPRDVMPGVPLGIRAYGVRHPEGGTAVASRIHRYYRPRRSVSGNLWRQEQNHWCEFPHRPRWVHLNRHPADELHDSARIYARLLERRWVL